MEIEHFQQESNFIIIKPFDSFKLFEIIKILTSKSKNSTKHKITTH
jgi:hypothetical protein